MGMLAADHNRAFLAARQRGDVAVTADLTRRRREIVGLVEGADLGLIGKEDVDMLGDEIAELGAVAADAERVAEAEADPPPGLMRERRRLAEGLLGARRIEKIAFEVGHLRRRDDLG